MCAAPLTEAAVAPLLKQCVKDLDDPVVEYLAGLIVEASTKAPVSPDLLHHTISELLVSYDACADEASAKKTCTKLCDLMIKQGIIKPLDAEASKPASGQTEEDMYHYVIVTEMLRPRLQPGVAVLAKYSKDRKWYPARIESITASGQYYVLFLEYGNKETLDLGQIKIKEKKPYGFVSEVEYNAVRLLANPVRIADFGEELERLKQEREKANKPQLSEEGPTKKQLKKEAKERQKRALAERREKARQARAEKLKLEALKRYLSSDPRGKSKEIDIPNVTLATPDGSNELLANGWVRFIQGRRYGLIGRNGIGKTTLMRHISNYELPNFPPHIRVVHVEQEVMGDDTKVINAVLEADVERTMLLEEEAKLMSMVDTSEIEKAKAQADSEVKKRDAEEKKQAKARAANDAKLAKEQQQMEEQLRKQKEREDAELRDILDDLDNDEDVDVEEEDQSLAPPEKKYNDDDEDEDDDDEDEKDELEEDEEDDKQEPIGDDGESEGEPEGDDDTLSISSSSSAASSVAANNKSSKRSRAKQHGKKKGATTTDKKKIVLDEPATPIDPSKRLSQIYTRMREIDVWGAEARARAILTGLQFSTERQEMKTKELSGGWRMRVALACALFVNPDLLLLDEPTNHLDFPAVLWLEKYLQNYEKTLVIVSHDRQFLNHVITDVIHFHARTLTYYRGDYQNYEKVRAETLKTMKREYEAQKMKRAHIQKFIDKFRYNAKRAALVQSRIKALKKMDELLEVVEEAEFRMQFPDPDRIDGAVITCDKVKFGYDANNILLSDVTLNVDMDSRIGVLGANGVGKSTLLNLLIGKIQPLEGTVIRNSSARISTFAQHHMEQLNLQQSSLDLLMELFPKVHPQLLRRHLGQFGITGDLALQTIGSLSGGQKSRVAFSIVTFKKPHVIIMDEPTNHLDLETIDALILAVQNWGGGILLVSHDQHFLSAVGNEFWGVSAGKVKRFDNFESSKKFSYSN